MSVASVKLRACVPPAHHRRQQSLESAVTSALPIMSGHSQNALDCVEIALNFVSGGSQTSGLADFVPKLRIKQCRHAACQRAHVFGIRPHEAGAAVVDQAPPRRSSQW